MNLRAELEQLTTPELLADIQVSRELARHPYATDVDEKFYRVRISVAEDIIVARFRAALDDPQGPPSKAPRDEIPEQLRLSQNRNAKIDIPENELAVRSLLLLSQKALEARLANIHAKLRHPHLEKGSESEKRLRTDYTYTKQALKLKKAMEEET